MKAYVTGASGFVGGHVARELAELGAEVRTERVDLLDRAELRRVIDGCDAVFHVAALYSYDADPRMIERVNVEGTRNVIEACISTGVKRLVHTSTAGTCGPVSGRSATEDDTPPAWELAVPYKRTKRDAERLVVGAAARAAGSECCSSAATSAISAHAVWEGVESPRPRQAAPSSPTL